MKTLFRLYIFLFTLLIVLPVSSMATSVIVTNTNNSGAGSLRQAIIDANANPVDSIIFHIPLSDPGYITTRGVFRIGINGFELNAITRANLVVDGTTQTQFTGNTNSAILGLGGTVGVDSIAFPKFDGPEIEIVDLNWDTTGIKIMASYVKVRGLCVYGFGRSFSADHGNIVVHGGVKHVIIENNVLGVPADQFVKPETALYTGGCNLMVYYADSGIVRNNLMAWGGVAGMYFNQTTGWLIEYNEFANNGFGTPNLDGSDLGYGTKGAIERYNHSYGNAANGMDSYLSYGFHVFENNTIENNGIRCWETSGLRIYGVYDYIHKNIIADNVGSGILITSGADFITISENAIYENGILTGPYNTTPKKAIGINLNTPNDDSFLGTAPYFNLNDLGDYDFGGNTIINYPVITNTKVVGNTFLVEGYTLPGSKVEFFIGDTSSLKDFPQGKTFLFSRVEGSADDLDNTTGSYGPLPINGVNQGQDSTNKFKFSVPLPAKLHLGDVITSTATLNNRTSEFSPASQAQLGSNPLAPVTPMFDCVYKNYNGSYTALFGYTNSNTTTVNIPIGTNNQFIPAPQSQGQPTAFLSGSHDLLFSVPFTGNSLTWKLDSTSIVVTPTSNQCPVDLVVTKLLTNPVPNSTDTIFKGDTVTFTITLKNNSLYFPSSSISLLDTLPSAFTFVSANASLGSYNHSTGLWNIQTLAAQGTAVLTINAIVDTSSQNDVYIVSQSQPDPNILNNHSFASVTMSNSSSGNNGGLESNGNLASKIAVRNFLRNKEQLKNYNNSAELQPFFESVDISDVPTSKAMNTQSTDIVNFIPQNGPAGSTAFISTPTDLLGVSNATEVFSVDYFVNNSDRKAAILGIATPAGVVYGHTKVVCDRLNGATLENINHIIIKDHPFIIAKLVQDNGEVDYAISFIAYKNGQTYSIDNRWDLDSYHPNGNNPVLNFQVWSTSERYTLELVSAIIDKMNANNFTVNYINNYPAIIPNVYVRSGYYLNGNLVLDIVNNANANEVFLNGTTASVESGTRTTYNNVIECSSTQTSSTIVLPIARIFDIGFNLTNNRTGGVDVLYYADGPWGNEYDQNGATVSNFTIDNQNIVNYANSYNVQRNVSITGTVQTYASLFRVLKVGNKAVDVSNYKYIEFNASGSGLFTLVISKKSITSWADQYKITLNLTSTATHYKIKLADLTNSQGLQSFNANDLVSVTFVKNGNNSTYQNFNIAVDNLHFSGIISDVNEVIKENAATLTTYPNPFTEQTTISFNITKTSKVKISVFSLEGKLISVLTDESFSEGIHTVEFNAANLRGGIYMVRLESDKIIQYNKIILMR